jgi:hypothetical protein
MPKLHVKPVSEGWKKRARQGRNLPAWPRFILTLREEGTRRDDPAFAARWLKAATARIKGRKS